MNAALQLMLMQPGDDPGSFTNGTMVLFPSWNCQWDVDFKIHGPLATVVEGVLVNGKLVSLNVTPAARKSAVLVANCATQGEADALLQ
jgi:hypothetical protein